jgi:4-amino-4-deoxy-L-arabinose transferase-like glycosyltransferase
LKVVGVAVCVGIALRVSFLLLVPFEGESETGKLSAYNDECAHFNYIRHLIEERRLPSTGISLQESGVTATATFEHYQPPLYYLVCAPAVALWQRINPGTSYLAARIVSFIAGILLLPLVFSIGMRFGLSRLIATSAVIATSVLGGLVRFSVLVSNDAFCWLFAGLAIYFWLRAEDDSSPLYYWLLWCFAVIAGLYTKLSILLLLPLPVICSLLQRRWQRAFRWLVLTAIALIATLPIWVRNVQAFGSLLPLSAGFGEAKVASTAPLSVLAYALRSFLFPWQEFWGGWPGALIIVGILLMCLYLIISSRARFGDLRHPIQLVILWIAAIVGFAWLNLHYFQAEGRYLLISWPAWMVIFAVGARTPARQWVLFAALLAPYLLFLIPFGEWVRV